MKTTDIVWVCGLLEGEGTFLYNKQSIPMIQVGMTDKDVVERVARILGTKAMGPYRPTPNPKHKSRYVATVSGKRAIGWMMTLLPMLGERRRARVLEHIASWKHYVRKDRKGFIGPRLPMKVRSKTPMSDYRIDRLLGRVRRRFEAKQNSLDK